MTIGYADLDAKLADASSVVRGGRLDTNSFLTTDERHLRVLRGLGGHALVVNVSQIVTLDKGRLRARIGALSPERVREVLRGINLVLEPREVGR
jgi:PemK-like, MazF-like toxin of type II toxin-antitoxin system